MALTNDTADAVVEGILADLGLSEAQAELARSRWRAVVRRLYAGIKADAEVPIYGAAVVPPETPTSGLQTSTAPGVATAAPALTKTLRIV